MVVSCLSRRVKKWTANTQKLSTIIAGTGLTGPSDVSFSGAPHLMYSLSQRHFTTCSAGCLWVPAYLNMHSTSTAHPHMSHFAVLLMDRLRPGPLSAQRRWQLGKYSQTDIVMINQKLQAPQPAAAAQPKCSTTLFIPVSVLMLKIYFKIPELAQSFESGSFPNVGQCALNHACLHCASQIAVDGAGNVYFADYWGRA